MEKILVSACLLGRNCRYDGKNCSSAEVRELEKKYILIPVCPEELGGLSTPRIPSEIRDGRVYDREGNDVTEYFLTGADKALQRAFEEGISIALFKSLSPSCGSKIVYNGHFDGGKTEGDGITAALLKKHGISVYTEEEIEKL